MNIIRGKQPGAKKVVIYGPEGIGKSTFASRFPDPVFIDTEGSTKDMDVARFEKASSWEMLLQQIDYVKTTPGLCRTLVIDTIDWAEQMCIQAICDKHHKDGLESFGYGNGYIYVKEEFGRFLNRLSDVTDAGINVVLTAHAQLRKFEQPDELGAYDRWELKLGKKTQSQTSPLVKEWSDMLLFANYKTFSVAVDKEGKKHKAQGGSRVMYTSHHPCWDAKNRYGLPEETAFDYEVIRSIIEGSVSVATKAPVVQKPSSEPERPERRPESQATPPAVATPQQPVGDIPDGTQFSLDDMMNQPKEQKSPKSNPVNDRLPKALRDLMNINQVTTWDIQAVVAKRGYFPEDMPVEDYPQDFIDGVLVGAWPKVYGMIKDMKLEQQKEIPF
ncbi:MAG TPA: ATP-binding protein [Candidatus Merdisoma merdipullorum]|nr:ATP-binding protein [Candidatus Merdisoma merdipullorum]